MILVVDINQERDSLGLYEFVLPIVSIVKSHEEYMIRHYRELDAELVARAHRIILSGTPLKDRECFEHIQEFRWLKDHEKPVLGICAGMQVLGLVFGGELKECLEIGMTKILTTSENPLFKGGFEAYELHNFSVEPSQEFELLAESGRCVQAIKHRKKNIYGVLFHPEVRNREIVENFIRLEP